MLVPPSAFVLFDLSKWFLSCINGYYCVYLLGIGFTFSLTALLVTNCFLVEGLLAFVECWLLFLENKDVDEPVEAVFGDDSC